MCILTMGISSTLKADFCQLRTLFPCQTHTLPSSYLEKAQPTGFHPCLISARHKEAVTYGFNEKET